MCLSIVPSTRRQYAYSGDLSGTTSISRALLTFAISIYPSLLFLPPLTSFNRCYPPSLPPSLPLYPTWLPLWSTSLAPPSNSYLPLPPSCPPPSLPCCHPRLPPSSASLSNPCPIPVYLIILPASSACYLFNPYLRRLPSCLHSSPPCCLPGLPVCQLPTRHPTPSHCTLLDLSHPRPPSPYLLLIYSRIIHSFIHSKPYLDTAGCTRDG